MNHRKEFFNWKLFLFLFYNLLHQICSYLCKYNNVRTSIFWFIKSLKFLTISIKSSAFHVHSTELIKSVFNFTSWKGVKFWNNFTAFHGLQKNNVLYKHFLKTQIRSFLFHNIIFILYTWSKTVNYSQNISNLSYLQVALDIQLRKLKRVYTVKNYKNFIINFDFLWALWHQNALKLHHQHMIEQ